MLLIGLFHVSGIFAARTPARRTLQFRECCGLPTVNRYHGTLTPPRIAPSRPKKSRDGSIIISNFSIMAISRTTRLFSLSVDRSLPSGGHGGRRQVASRKEERSAALTILLSRNREGGSCLPLHFTTDIFLRFVHSKFKKIFEFFFYSFFYL